MFLDCAATQRPDNKPNQTQGGTHKLKGPWSISGVEPRSVTDCSAASASQTVSSLTQKQHSRVPQILTGINLDRIKDQRVRQTDTDLFS